MVLNEELRISTSLTEEFRLNRLEQFLFKNPIPFIRIANCKMGRYLKVHGNLILISSDLDHTMSKILPIEQQIIPVSLKRKLAYKGFYMEEWVDKNKVEIYFDWFKTNNPFFKDLQLNKTRISEIEQNIFEDVEEYRNQPEHSIDDEIEKGSISDDSDDEYIGRGYDQFNGPLDIEDEINIQHYDSILCNKYEHELFEESVVKKYADIITQFETSSNILADFPDDFEQNDNVNDEKEIDNLGEDFELANANTNRSNFDKVKSMPIKEVGTKAKERIRNVREKVEKNCITRYFNTSF